MNKEDILLIAKITLTFLTIVSVLFAIYYNYRKLREKELITKLKEKLQKKIKQVEQAELEKSNLEKRSQELVTKLLAENQELRRKRCQRCKVVYSYMVADELSLSENLDKYSLPDENSDERKLIYYLEDKYLFINFCPEEANGKCYLINLNNGSIYLPLDEWKQSKEDELLSYRKLCSDRRTHIDNKRTLLV